MSGSNRNFEGTVDSGRDHSKPLLSAHGFCTTTTASDIPHYYVPLSSVHYDHVIITAHILVDIFLCLVN